MIPEPISVASPVIKTVIAILQTRVLALGSSRPALSNAKAAEPRWPLSLSWFCGGEPNPLVHIAGNPMWMDGAWTVFWYNFEVSGQKGPFWPTASGSKAVIVSPVQLCLCHVPLGYV